MVQGNNKVHNIANKNEEKSIELKPIYFKIVLKVLFYLGINILPIETKINQFIYKIYSFFSIGILLLFTVMEGLDIIFNFEGIDRMTFALCYFVTHVLGTAKIFLMLYHKKTLWKTFQKIEKGIFKPSMCRGGVIEYTLIKRAIRYCNTQMFVFYTFVFVIIGQRLLYSILDPGIDKEIPTSTNTTMIIHIRTTPYTTWVPYLDINKSPTYEILCAYQIFVTVVYGLHIGAADAVICGFMMFIKAQFLILKRALDTLIERSEKMAVSDRLSGMDRIELLDESVQKKAEVLARSCVKHHQELINLCDEAEETFCYLMLMQFLSSLLILCFQLFQISTVSVSSIAFFSMVCYLMLMVFQLLCYCYNGNEVQIISGKVGIYAYEINWIVTNETVKKYLLMMMMRSQRSFCFTAGKFSILSLPTFMNIVRGAGSYFMVLRQMNT